MKIYLDGQEQSWTSVYNWTSTTGTHLVRVDAVDARGLSSSEQIQIDIVDPTNPAPTVDDISVNPDPATVGNSI